MSDMITKPDLRRMLRERISALTPEDRHAKSATACALVEATPEFNQARVVMLYLSTPEEVDTSPLALRCWRSGKTVVAPKVSWEQRRMLPVEISSLQTNLTSTGPGIREPLTGKPIPIDFIDLVIVPGLGFSHTGHRIGRGMGFYDRFLAQREFMGISCGLAFDEQCLPELPVLDHDMPLSMLVTDRGVRRFSATCIQQS